MKNKLISLVFIFFLLGCIRVNKDFSPPTISPKHISSSDKSSSYVGNSTFQTVQTIHENISAQNAYQKTQNYNSSQLKILDIRNSVAFDEDHLNNAQNIPYSSAFISQIENFDKSLIYLIYSQDGQEGSTATSKMHNQSFREVYNINDGFNGWITDKLPSVNYFLESIFAEAGNNIINANQQ